MKWGKMSSKYSPGLKSRVGLAALRGDKIIAELCQEFDVASSQIYAWKKEALKFLKLSALKTPTLQKLIRSME